MSRIIGIRHRIKKTAAGEARPTQVTILDDQGQYKLTLATEDDELDFVRGRYPTSWQKVPYSQELSRTYLKHHIRREPRSEDVDPKSCNPLDFVYTVPASYEGFRPYDRMAMILGGSGDNLAFALSRRGESIAAQVYRLPPAVLKSQRQNGSEGKETDDQLLAELLRDQPDLFYLTTPRDRLLIQVREAYRARMEAMQATVACEQRLRQRSIGSVFRAEGGLFEEGTIEAFYDEQKANDVIMEALMTERKHREKELAAVLSQLPIWTDVLEPVEGIGPLIAGRIIAAIGDIRRFTKRSKLEAYASTFCPGDKFPRRRKGELANWNPDLRQALYLLGDQWNRRPQSYWGQKLRVNRDRLLERHPEPIVVDGKKRYGKGHLLKMAQWRTRQQFVRWLFRAWWQLETQSTELKEAV